jgi:hypothetical protein
MKLIIISTCTNNKNYKVPAGCNLDDLKRNTYKWSINSWLEHIQNPAHSRYPVYDLYSGSHWKETLACIDAARDKGFLPELWVMSAGCGLISANHAVVPYSATFAQEENSIHSLEWPKELCEKERSRIWWKEINSKKCIKLPGTFLELYRSFNKTENVFFLFILSKDYYLAVEPEIIELVAFLENVSIVSCGTFSRISRVSPLVRDHVLPVGEKFKQENDYLNKDNMSLNARIAKWIILNYSDALHLGYRELYKEIKTKDLQLEKPKKPKPASLSDEEIMAFIHKAYKSSTTTATALLTDLRHKENKSCEWRRFVRLFKLYTNSYSKGGYANA